MKLFHWFSQRGIQYCIIDVLYLQFVTVFSTVVSLRRFAYLSVLVRFCVSRILLSCHVIVYLAYCVVNFFYTMIGIHA